MNNINFKSEFTLKNGLLFVISGPSGAGKSLICKEYLKQNPNTFLSISETTRKPRKNEIDGKDYFFVDDDLFLSRVDQNYYLEHAGKYQNRYGTPKEPILTALNEGKDVILEIDPQGASQIREEFPQVISVFVLPVSTEVLLKQIEGRKTESKEQIKIRMAETKKEVEQIKYYDYVIINRIGFLEDSVKLLSDIAKSERCNVKRILNQKEDENE